MMAFRKRTIGTAARITPINLYTEILFDNRRRQERLKEAIIGSVQQPSLLSHLELPRRNAVCAKDQPGGVCMIQTYDQLITFAHGTAAKPVRDPALAVILVK
jgi:hypothetical protein